MDPPSGPPRSGEDLSRAFRNLPPGTLSGLDALCDHNYWLSVMRQAEIEISNVDIFRFRFSEISKSASNRLAFLAGSGEYGSFNLRYLIQQLVEQCADMHKYTRKLEKYVVKLQRQVEDLEAEQRQRDREQPPQQLQQQLPPQQQQLHGSGGGGSGTSGSGPSAGGGKGGAAHQHPSAYPHARPQLGGMLAPPGPVAGQPMGGSKRARSPPPGSVEAAGSSLAAEQDDE
ncbi:hypothetical protein PLESTM_001200400 [Pleodorina starrii]|nr:hypothetical protein PLESTM_001200400 [Pleodorina starrii]